MDYFFAHTSALTLVRYIRCGSDLTLATTDVCEVTPLGGTRLSLHALGIPGLCNLLDITSANALELLVPSRTDRHRCAGIVCSVRSAPKSEQPYLQVVPADEEVGSDLLPKGVRVFVESPPSIVLGMSATLTHLENTDKITHERACLKLLKLCLELCGTYSCSPNDPLMGEAICETTPVMRIEDLLDVINRSKSVRGVRLLREVVTQVFELSGSPAESHLGPALFGLEKFGGFELGEYKANAPLELTSAQRHVLTCNEIRPDFQMEQYRIAIERNGRVHEEGDNPQRDRLRMLDYQTAGWKVFNLFSNDVRTPEAFNRTVSRIVSAIAHYEGPKVERRFRQLVGDSEFLARQKILFEVFCPWLYN